MIILVFFLSHWFLSLFFQTFFQHRYASHKMFKMNNFWEKTFYFFTFFFSGFVIFEPACLRHYAPYASCLQRYGKGSPLTALYKRCFRPDAENQRYLPQLPAVQTRTGTPIPRPLPYLVICGPYWRSLGHACMFWYRLYRFLCCFRDALVDVFAVADPLPDGPDTRRYRQLVRA